MQFKKGDGWKACYDEETGRYTAERSGPGYYNLYEITEEIFDALADGMNDWDCYHLVSKGRNLYMDVNDRCGPPYTIIFDHDYEKICPLSSNFAKEKCGAPHSWHSSEMFLYLHEKRN